MIITPEPASPTMIAALRRLADDETLAAHLTDELLARTNRECVAHCIFLVEPALFVVSPADSTGRRIIEGPRPKMDGDPDAATPAQWIQFVQITAAVVSALEDDLRRSFLPRHLRKRTSTGVRDGIVRRFEEAIRDKNPLIARRPVPSTPAT